MNEETTILEKSVVDNSKESSVFGISVRAWLAVVIVGTVCLISIAQAYFSLVQKQDFVIGEPLYTMSALAIGFYFGQKKN